MKMLFHVANFFFLPLKNMTVESNPITNRTYFIHKGKIVAVAGRV